ncbi:glycoside hydrolase family 99-like domain-containing protein [Cellulomonas hominis]|uniref:glycosyltransferase WbsX family protein n=1 Tax=Cellulomonas hominis TaxID=156981 RepID=UPI001443EE4D|nr:glycoside hydrolase family 99-like domain-containing protein [Cellulomonas hominis]NKY09173.1 lipopolysaccharide biosynthesis protein [Cellulomonas hominis]
MSDPATRTIAFYLPQYHPVPENDEWWGPGFTEWTNTARARRLFPGHVQPHLPADLGFYDLRLPETREAQARLARTYGVTAFAYWHYWFGRGRRMLERPFQEVLASGAPDLPFCLAWANQTWSGVWHGAGDRVLVEQTYPGPEDDAAHFAAILPAFRDERYLRVEDRPVFYVHRPVALPGTTGEWVDRWQDMARAAGLPGLYLVAEVLDWFDWGPLYTDVEAAGFDAGVYMRLPMRFTRREFWQRRVQRHLTALPEIYPATTRYLDRDLPAGHQPCVYPNWDNTPRSGRRGVVLTGTGPELFRQHVQQAARALRDRPAAERLLWVKSWNEWAEGNYLEPDLEHGHGWLRALRDGLADAAAPTVVPEPVRSDRRVPS